MKPEGPGDGPDAGDPAQAARAAAVPRPLRRDAERNRQRILTAAAEVFNDRGLEVSLDEVARHAAPGAGAAAGRDGTDHAPARAAAPLT